MNKCSRCDGQGYTYSVGFSAERGGHHAVKEECYPCKVRLVKIAAMANLTSAKVDLLKITTDACLLSHMHEDDRGQLFEALDMVNAQIKSLGDL